MRKRDYPEWFCAHCGTDFADCGLEEGPTPELTADDGTVYCCVDCLHEGENERWENAAYSHIPPHYND